MEGAVTLAVPRRAVASKRAGLATSMLGVTSPRSPWSHSPQRRRPHILHFGALAIGRRLRVSLGVEGVVAGEPVTSILWFKDRPRLHPSSMTGYVFLSLGSQRCLALGHLERSFGSLGTGSSGHFPSCIPAGVFPPTIPG